MKTKSCGSILLFTFLFSCFIVGCGTNRAELPGLIKERTNLCFPDEFEIMSSENTGISLFHPDFGETFNLQMNSVQMKSLINQVRQTASYVDSILFSDGFDLFADMKSELNRSRANPLKSDDPVEVVVANRYNGVWLKTNNGFSFKKFTRKVQYTEILLDTNTNRVHFNYFDE